MTRTYQENGYLEIYGSDLYSLKLIVNKFDVTSIAEMAARRIAVNQNRASGLSWSKSRCASKNAIASVEMKSIVRAALERGANPEQAIHSAMKASKLKIVKENDMKNTFDYLHAGLLELSEKNSNSCAGSAGWMLGYLEVSVSNLIEGAAHERKEARQALQKIIGRGRCILNADDLAVKKTVDNMAKTKNNCMVCTAPATNFRMPCDPVNMGGKGVCVS